jgi:hypothetical protein
MGSDPIGIWAVVAYFNVSNIQFNESVSDAADSLMSILPHSKRTESETWRTLSSSFSFLVVTPCIDVVGYLSMWYDCAHTHLLNATLNGAFCLSCRLILHLKVMYIYPDSVAETSAVGKIFTDVGGYIQKFPDWPPGARTANGIALCHYVQSYRYLVSQSSEFCPHNPLCCFSTSNTKGKRIFRCRLSPETFGYTFVWPGRCGCTRRKAASYTRLGQRSNVDTANELKRQLDMAFIQNSGNSEVIKAQYATISRPTSP